MNWIWFGGLVVVTVISFGIVFLMEYKNKYFDKEYDENHEHDAQYEEHNNKKENGE